MGSQSWLVVGQSIYGLTEEFGYLCPGKSGTLSGALERGWWKTASSEEDVFYC
jgi:hypothetical protein